MPIDQTRRTKRTLAALTLGATALTVSASALAQSAGADKGLGQSGLAQSVQADSAAVQTAQALVEQDKLIQARATLDRLIGSSRFASLSDGQRTAALSLLKKVDSKIQTADAVEMSLQKAEWAAGEGDLLQAERQAKAVAGRSSATSGQKARAEDVLASVAQRRSELAPLTPGLLEQATASMNAGDYPAAKATILGLMRSGVSLSGEQAKGLEAAQLKIVELEQKAGKAFELPASSSLAVMQPGQVRRPGKDAGRDEPLPTALAQAQPSDPAYPADPAPSQPAPVQLPPSNLPPPAPMIADAPTVSQAAAPQDDIVTQAMRIEAQRIVAEADQAFDQARYGVAADRYTLALAQFRQYLAAGEVARIEGRISEARVRLAGGTGGGAGGSDIARDVVASQTLIRDRAQAEFNSFLAQAEARLTEGAADRAQDLAAQAQLSISRARSSFNDAEFAAFNTRLDELKARIGAKRDEIARTEADRRQKELQDKARQTEASRLAERDRKIGESIDRIRALQADRKYEEALQVVDQTLFLDPNNPTALLLRDILRDLAIYQRYNDLEDKKAYNHALQSLDNSESTIPPPNMMNFPTDWPAKTFARGETAAFADSAENRKVLAQISSNASRIPSIDLNENRFEDAIKFLAQVSNLSFDPDWEALAGVGVERDTLVTLKLTNATVKTVLDRLTQKVSRDQFARAGWAVNEGVLVISSDEALRRNRTLVIYNIQDLLFEIPNYPDVPQIDLNNVLQQSQSGGGGGGQSPFTNVNNNQNANAQQIAQARAARLRQIIDIIQQNVDFDGWKDNGGETGALQELNGSLIITNTPKNHREIVGLLSKLREIRNMQINVETKFLLVNQQWFEQIGFDLDIIWNANSSQVQQAQGQNPNTLPSDFFDFSGTSRPRGLQRTGLNVPINPGSGNPATVTGGQPNRFSPVGSQQNSFGLTNSLAEGDFATSILGQAPALGIAGQFLDDIQVDFLIQATQADKRTVRLTAPRLTFTNGQQANIYVVTQQAFVSGLQPIVGDSAVGFNPQVSVLSEGVTMLVEGVISSDRRYVTLNIDAGVARLDGFQQSSVSAVAGGQLVNSANTQSFIQLPQITVTRVRTTATVPDEGTVLLGGQRLVTEVEVETGVPVLSKIPIINRFFTNRLESKEEQTLLILVKPTVLIQTEQEEKSFPGLLDSVRTGLTR